MADIRLRIGAPIVMTFVAVAATVSRANEADDLARALVREHEERIRPLEIESARRWWDANVSGADADYAAKQEAETKLDLALADRERFARLKGCDGLKPSDPRLARQVHLLYLQALPKQLDPDLLKEMVDLANAIEKRFNAYRAKVDGEEIPDSTVRKTLRESKDSTERRKAWEGSKGVGAEVATDLAKLVSLRNRAAKEQGFADYHDMQLQINEQSQAQVLALFDELDELTREPFARLKADIDGKLAANCGVAVADLMPWHMQDPFFQEAPALAAADLDAVYRQADILALCRKFYSGIGLPIEDVLARSDLYEKDGKSPHAFCTDIDREGDVRVLANIVANEYWMGTMLHELGHAVYSSKNIPREMPYALRGEAHILTTEGVAMMFERYSKNAEWLQAMGVEVADPAGFNEAGRQMRKSRLLIFSRWCQVMFRFEMGMYGNPEQDLSELWWGLVEKYQLVKRPPGRHAPDYAAKIHIVSAPAYYHNYMMGELFACQVHRALLKSVLNSDDVDAIYVGNKGAGDFMKDRVFSQGRMLDWNALTKHATGEPLNAKAFAEEFK